MISDLPTLQQVTAFTFLVTFFGMSAAAVFLFAERDQVAPQSRTSVALAGLICAIAAANYFFMRQTYIEGALSRTAAFPTEFRYVDWILTVPLMLVQFPLHLGLGRRGRPFMVWLIALSLLMLVTGYIGEINVENTALHIQLWIVGCVAGLGIVVSLLWGLRTLPDRVPSSTVATVRAMTILVVVGWTIYPLGYLQPTLGLSPDVREVIYNVSDMVNKIGLGFLLFRGGRALQRTQTRSVRLDGSQAVPDGISPVNGADTPRRSPADSLLAQRH